MRRKRSKKKKINKNPMNKRKQGPFAKFNYRRYTSTNCTCQKYSGKSEKRVKKSSEKKLKKTQH